MILTPGMKRSFDILFSFAILIILLPLFLLIAMLIKLDSKGRVFFIQKRVGKNAREFALFKFRTMKEDSEKSGKLTVGDRDSRITSVGFYLRKYKIDELPQFFNVLKGDMSIVGPRPEVRRYVEMYTEEQKDVLSVRPGITDVASLQYSDESKMLAQYPDAEEAYIKEIMPAKLSLSLEYIKRRSFTADLGVMGKTVLKILSPFSLRSNAEAALLSLLVFSLPLYEKASAVLAVAVVAHRVFDRKVISDVQLVKRNILSVLFIAYYLAHVAGTIYSSNLSYAFFDLQIKLPFLAFPLLLLLPLERPQIFQNLKKYFIAGCTFASLFCLGAAMISFSKSHDPFDFFYISYSRFLHVTYFSLYLNLCILFLIDELVTEKKIPAGKAMFRITLIVFLFFTVILLSARTSLFTCFFTTLLYSVVISIHRKKIKYNYKVIVLLLLIIVAAGIYANNIFNRFDQVTEILQEVKTGTLENIQQGTQNYNSASTRVELWKDSWEMVKLNPLLGVGTGDIKDVLEKKFMEERFYYGAEKKFNPHNQYLHTAVALGLMGVLLLILIFAIPSYRALREKNYLFVFFCMAVALNCVTESVLEVQKGVLFFSLFSLLLFRPHSKTTG